MFVRHSRTSRLLGALFALALLAACGSDDDGSTGGDENEFTGEPDGGELVAVVRLGPAESTDDQPAVALLDLGSAQPPRTLSTLVGEEADSVIAVDAQRSVAYYSRVVTACSSDLMRTSTSQEDDVHLVGSGHSPAVNSKRDVMAFARISADEPADPSGACAGDEIVIRDLTGRDIDHVITADRSGSITVRGLTWMPDSTQLAVEAFDAEEDKWRLLLVDADAASLADATEVVVSNDVTIRLVRSNDSDLYMVELEDFDGARASRSHVVKIDPSTFEVTDRLLSVDGGVTDLSIHPTRSELLLVVESADGEASRHQLMRWANDELTEVRANVTSVAWLG